MPDKPKRYRLTLDFIVSINDEILDYSEESIAELDDDEKRALQAQRALLKGILEDKQGILEPPIMEFAVATGYRVLGGERLWLPRLFSTIFWLTGGGFLYLIGKRVADGDAALFGTAFYLFLPFATVASRSFQPDPLMVMLMLASVSR